MANILIAYASYYGQTEKIVRRMADVLRSRGDIVELLNTKSGEGDPLLERFDAVVVAAPIHARGYPSAISHFVKRNREALERAPSVFCSVGLAVASRTSDGRAQTQTVVDEFLKKTGWRPTRVELVAGSLPYTKYNFFIRFIMRRIAKAEGGDTDTSREYEYTDWAAVERFATELSADLARGHRATA